MHSGRQLTCSITGHNYTNVFQPEYLGLLGETAEREKMLARQIKDDPTYETGLERAASAYNRRQVEAGNKLEDELDRITVDLVVQNRIIEKSHGGAGSS